MPNRMQALRPPTKFRDFSMVDIEIVKLTCKREEVSFFALSHLHDSRKFRDAAGDARMAETHGKNR